MRGQIINAAMPEYAVNRVAEALNFQRKAFNGSKILVIGLAYKANVDDMRESATFHIMDLLAARQAQVSYCDPYIPEIGPTREHRNWMGFRSVTWNRETISSFDAVVIATAHKQINYEELANWSSCVIDTRNVMDARTDKIWRA